MPHSDIDADELAERKARMKAAELRATARFNRDMAARRQAESVVTAHTKGPLAMIDVGWSVWSRTDGTDIRLNDRGEPRGGVIVEIAGDVDRETGEMARTFRTIDPYRLPALAWCALPEQCVNPDGIETPDRHRTWRCIQALCLDAARPGHRLDLLRTQHDRTTAIAHAWRLARTVAT